MDDRRTQRGSALIEVMVSSIVLLVTVLLILDFARAFKAKQRTERAARQQTWSRARQDEFAPGQPDALSRTGLLQVHYDGVGEIPSTRVPFADKYHEPDMRVLPYRQVSVANFGLVRHYVAVLGFGAWFESEVWDFTTGKIVVVEADVAQALGAPTLRVLDDGELKSTHTVSLWAHASWNPEDPDGWWRNPFDSIRTRLFP